MGKYSVRDLTLSAMVAALYFVMGWFANVFGLTYGPIQFRFAEALTVLPFLFPVTVPGLFLGCLLTNLLSPYGVLDILFGSLATLIAAFWTSRIESKWLAPLPPVICNTVLVGFTIAFAEVGCSDALPAAWAYNGLTVGLGELGVCYVLGLGLLCLLPKIGYFRPMLEKRRLPNL